MKETNRKDTTMVQQRLEPLTEATKSLGLKDTRVITRLVRQGKLQAVTIGRRVFITTESLDAFASGDDTEIEAQ